MTLNTLAADVFVVCPRRFPIAKGTDETDGTNGFGMAGRWQDLWRENLFGFLGGQKRALFGADGELCPVGE